MRTIAFGACDVRIFDEDHFLETVFHDGTRVPASPEDTDQYRATARRLGYGIDTWALCRDHELSHTQLAELLGLPYSPTLWAVAHGHYWGIPGRMGEMMAEGNMVLAYQQWRLIRGERPSLT